MITVVTGFSRSGTSLMMKMLHRGGMEVCADNHDSYETGKMILLPGNQEWLKDCVGKAVKILDPEFYTPPMKYRYRFIWMRRTPKEQAKSQIKFLKATCPILPFDKKSANRMAKGIIKDTPKNLDLLSRYNASILQVNFEDLIFRPIDTAARVSNFCGGLNVTAMAACPLKRSPKCYKGFMELEN